MTFRQSSYELENLEATGSFTGSLTGSLRGTASIGERALSADGFTESFDGADEAGFNQWRAKLTSSISRTALGLIFRDTFNRANSAIVGNDWEEEGTWAIEGNKLEHESSFTDLTFTGSLTAERFPNKGLLNLPSKYMTQVNLALSNNASVEMGIRDSRNSTPDNRYEILSQDFGDQRQIRKTLSGSTSFQEIESFSHATGAFYGERLILEETGSEVAISGAFTLELSGSDSLDQPFDATVLSFLDNSSVIIQENNNVKIASFDNTFSDEYIIQGTEVVVNNLPTGWKAQLDDGPLVTEQGGSASIDVKTEPLPFATVSVYSSTDELQSHHFILSSSNPDGWGGDVYQFDQQLQLLTFSSSVEVDSALILNRDVSASRFLGTASFAERVLRRYINAGMSTDQTANLTSGSHIQFNLDRDSFDIPLTSGSGQNGGVFTLAPNRTYRLEAKAAFNFSANSGIVRYRWFNRTTAELLGITARVRPRSNAKDTTNQAEAGAVITPTASIDVDIRFPVTPTSLTAVRSGSAEVWIQEI